MRLGGIVCFLCLVWCISIWAQNDPGDTIQEFLSVEVNGSKTEKNTQIRVYRRMHAVIIGIDLYPNLTQNHQLTYAVRDARGVEELMRTHFLFTNIISIYNEKATKSGIIETLQTIPNCNKEDAVFVFFAGHGYTENMHFGEVAYILPSDALLLRRDFKEKMSNGISLTFLKEDIAKKIPAKHVFYVMDCCFTDILTKKNRVTKPSRTRDYLHRISVYPVCQVLTAGNENDYIREERPLGYTLFTSRFIEALKNTNDYITGSEISALIKLKFLQDARSSTHSIQSPQYAILSGWGDFIFIANPKAQNTNVLDNLQQLLEKEPKHKAQGDAQRLAEENASQKRTEQKKYAPKEKSKLASRIGILAFFSIWAGLGLILCRGKITGLYPSILLLGAVLCFFLLGPTRFPGEDYYFISKGEGCRFITYSTPSWALYPSSVLLILLLLVPKIPETFLLRRYILAGMWGLPLVTVWIGGSTIIPFPARIAAWLTLWLATVPCLQWEVEGGADGEDEPNIMSDVIFAIIVLIVLFLLIVTGKIFPSQWVIASAAGLSGLFVIGSWTVLRWDWAIARWKWTAPSGIVLFCILACGSVLGYMSTTKASVTTGDTTFVGVLFLGIILGTIGYWIINTLLCRYGFPAFDERRFHACRVWTALTQTVFILALAIS